MLRKQSVTQTQVRGASRKVAKPAVRANPGRIRRWLLGSVAICLVAVLFYMGQGYVIAVMERPVASVQVEGEFRFVSEARVVELVEPQINRSFLQLELAQIKTELEREPWIDRAALGRRWPDRLTVTIVEQQPIARWGESGFLNQRGEVVTIASLAQLDDLPVLYASIGREAELLAQYQDLSVLLRSRGLAIRELYCDEKRAWALTLNSGLKVVIGRDQVMEKMRRFLRVYDQSLAADLERVISVDVRYNNGVAVRWREPAAADKLNKRV